ncbi:MAG: YifB family Mg chelatase-like AAA ATPase [Clostridia bacterium]|nr:YifB family Mg chelatase-like AAA ATPase [Clostridia bacterium]
MIKVNKKLKYPSVVVLFCSKNHMIFTLCINRKKPCNHKKTTTVYMYSTILMIGTPGSGKSMLASRLPTILPDLTFEEALEVTKIHSIAGLLNEEKAFINTRPFRTPHHSTSTISLAGGGRVPKPGEVSLAHNGVLFLDEFPEFNKSALEILRQPIEDRTVTISRVNATITYPSDFMLIAAMNPCPCGYFGDKKHHCTCTTAQIHKYTSKISGPILDRIDLHIFVEPVEYSQLTSNEKAESSAEIKKRVNKARKIQVERYKELGIYSNASLDSQDLNTYCKLDDTAKKILESAFTKLGLSARAYTRIVKVARTIADLAGEENISFEHISEAIQFRTLDRQIFG